LFFMLVFSANWQISFLVFTSLIVGACSNPPRDGEDANSSGDLDGASDDRPRPRSGIKVTLPNPTTPPRNPPNSPTPPAGSSDTQAPLVTAALQPLNSTARARNITGSCEYDPSNSDATKVRISGLDAASANSSFSCPMSGNYSVLVNLSAEEGVKEVSVRQKDRANNEGRANTSGILTCQTDPVSISDASDFIQKMNANPYACYRLTASFSLGSMNPIPIFYGVLDGNDMEIGGIEIRGAPRYSAFININEGTLKNLRVSGLSVRAVGDVAGLVNTNRGTISRVFVYNADVLAHSTNWYENNVGGLVWMNVGSILRSSFNGSTRVEGVAGGLAFWNHGLIQDSFAQVRFLRNNESGDFASGTASGGIVAYNYGVNHPNAPGDKRARVERCFAVTTMGLNARSLVWQANGEGLLSSSYFDRDACSSGAPCADGGGMGKTTDQMKTVAGFDGWDFTNVWKPASGFTPFSGVYHSLR
jgi:hypothetical protein